MKDRLLKGWTIRRAMYLILGCIAIAQAIITKQYLLILFGGYFASMGLFAFGCASGQCNIEPPHTMKRRTENEH